MIKLLEAQVYELIAAGEVVERPASAVKELVENSIDAGAKSISIKILRGGLDEIRITDDGCGIPREQLPTAFLRHATSKISNKDDLDSITTLGFRGEALPSISAVSRIEFTSKPVNQDFAVRYTASAGESAELEECGAPDGSCVRVADIFYNTPARMKFLKSDAAEGAAVQDCVQQLALAHPEIAFSFSKDGKHVFFTPGDNRLLSVIFAFFPRETSAAMLFAEGQTGGVSVDGYVCAPSGRRASRALQYTYVNGRFVKDKTVTAAVEQAFRSVAGSAGFPAFVINVRLDPAAVDVNVHPAKTQVRFANDKNVFSAVYHAVKLALENSAGSLNGELASLTDSAVTGENSAASQTNATDNIQDVVTAANSGVKSPAVFSHEKAHSREQAHSTTRADDISPIVSYAPSSELPGTHEMFTQAGIPHEHSKTDSCTCETAVGMIEANSQPQSSQENALLSGAGEHALERSGTVGAGNFSQAAQQVSPEINDFQQTLVEFESATATKTAQLEYVGELFSLYIVAQFGETVVFIDKHAAHERVLYEKLTQLEITAQRQTLLSPVVVELSPTQKQLCLDSSQDMFAAGFVVEDFGGNALAVREIPTFYKQAAVASAVESFARQLEYGRTDLSDKNAVFLLRNIACRAAVKSGDISTREELMSIASDILCGNISKLCPHGRPVVFTLTKKELERRFDRC